ITSSADFLWCSFCSGQRDKSCSHHFVLNFASQTSVSIEFAPDCSWIVQCLQISLSQSSSVRTNPDNVLVLVAVIAFICNSFGLRHPMKLVPLVTLVHMDIKAFPSSPSVPFLITNSIIYHQPMALSVFPTLLMFFLVTQVRNCEDESRILNDLHRITYAAVIRLQLLSIIWL
ncbi:hypothetical protein T03_2861, partial [Trichinella britovi]